MERTREEIKIPDMEQISEQEGYEFVTQLAVRLVYAMEDVADNINFHIKGKSQEKEK